MVAQIEDRCGVYFSFAPNEKGRESLWRVRVILEGSRQDAFRDAEILATAFGPRLTRTEQRELKEGLETSTSWRVPRAVDLPAVLTIRAITIRRNPREEANETQLWQTELIYDRVNEPPVRKH